MSQKQLSGSKNGKELSCSLSKGNAGLSRSQQKWLQIAIEIARENSYRWKHGAVIVRAGHVEVGQSKRRNNPKSMSPEHLNDCSVHAEMDAISKMRNPRGATVYVARVNKKGDICNSRPCINCEIAMDKIGIRKVVYTCLH